MNPNHYLAVAIRYLLTHRPSGATTVAVGKTLVSSSMIDRVVKKLGRELREVPVGFQVVCAGPGRWLVLFRRRRERGSEFLRLDGTVWTTDKDGLIMDLLAAEITARTGNNPGEHYRELTAEFGTRTTRASTRPPRPSRKQSCKSSSPDAVKELDLAGEPITAKLTKAPGNNAPIGGLKVVAETGGLRPGPPAPRTSTKSMRRVSRAKRI
jgi:phosphoglucomutase